MKLRKVHITNTAKVLLALVIAMVVIGFAERKGTDNTCADIVIRIHNQAENYFVDETDILRLMTANGDEVIVGTSFDDLNLKEIEQRVKEEPFIKEVEIYKDLKGHMLVEAKLRRPFARIITTKGSNYVALDGTLLPVTGKYNTRVLILSGGYFEQQDLNNLKADKDGEGLFEFLNYMEANKFWEAQIAQVDVNADMDIKLYPQVTKQVVEFGTPDNYKKKLSKLKIFYKKILPQKGWNTYERVNLKYDHQIIAE